METLSDKIEKLLVWDGSKASPVDSSASLNIHDVKEFIKRLLWHTQVKTAIFSDEQNKLVNEWKDSMADTIKRLAGDKLI